MKHLYRCTILLAFIFSFPCLMKANVSPNFSFSTPGAAPSTIQFTDMSTTSTGTIQSWSWNFGDGSASVSITNPSHVYLYPGVYNVTLTVTNSVAESGTIIKSLVISYMPVATTATFSTNMGKEFWFGYGLHQLMDGSSGNTQDLRFYIATGNEASQVTITIDSSGPTAYLKTYNIPANSFLISENMPKGSVGASSSQSDPSYDARLFTDPPPIGSSSEGLFRKKALHITSNAPVSIQAQISGSVTSGMTTLLPVNTWGYNYYSINSEQTNGGSIGASWIYIIAKENNTAVSINPSAVTRTGKPANTAFTVIMHKGQIYQLLATSDAQGTGANLTGTVVRSIPGSDGQYHPIAVFAGSSRTAGETVPCGTGSGRDNDVQQLMPTTNWGKEFLTSPVPVATGSGPATLTPTQFQTSVYKILVADPTTIVRRNGASLTGLVNSNYYKFSSNTADHITTDKPVQVAQFLSGGSPCVNGSLGDPDMVFVQPVNPGTKEVIFTRTTRENIIANYISLIIPSAGTSSLLIDGSPVISHSFPHPALPGYTVVIKGWQASQSICRIKSDSAFTATCYGLGAAESYAFNAGWAIKTADSARTNICPETGSVNLICPSQAVNYRWQVSTNDGDFTGLTDNSNYYGTSSSTLTLSNLPSSYYNYRYRCIADGEIGTTFIIGFRNEWIGNTGAWENGANWSCGNPPFSTSDVIIPAGAQVVLSSNVTVRTLTIHPGASFTIQPGYNVTITN